MMLWYNTNFKVATLSGKNIWNKEGHILLSTSKFVSMRVIGKNITCTWLFTV